MFSNSRIRGFWLQKINRELGDFPVLRTRVHQWSALLCMEAVLVRSGGRVTSKSFTAKKLAVLDND